MLKNEFLQMMEQDLITKNDPNLKDMLTCFKMCLSIFPNYTEIDSTKSVEDCYKKMKAEAQKKARGGSYCFGPAETEKFVMEYLGLKKIENVDLSDFI